MARLVLVTKEAEAVGERVQELVAAVLFLAVEMRSAADAGDVDRLRTETRRLANLTSLLDHELRR